MEVLAELVARITADATQLKKELANAEKDINGLGKTTEKETKSIKESFLEMGKAATIAGVAITAAMTKMIMSFAQTGSELHDLSLKTGVSVEALAGLKYAAEQNGASLGTVEMAIKRTAMVMADAADETGEAVKTFKKLGLSLKDLQGLNPEQQFLKIAGAIAEVPNPMNRAALAVQMFGRSGTDMLPMLSMGAAGLKKLTEEGLKSNQWTTAGANLADELGDAFGALKESTSGLFNIISSSLAPVLRDITAMLKGLVLTTIEWAKEHPALVKAISTATLAMGVFATSFGLTSLAVKYLGTVINLQFGGILLIVGAVVTGVILLMDWFNRAGIASRKLAEENRAALEKQKADTKTYFATRRAAVDADYANAKQKIKDEYGDITNLKKGKIEAAKDATSAIIDSYDREKDAARERYGLEIEALQTAYDLKIKNLDQATNDAIDGYQAQIDALEKQTEDEDLVLTRAAEQKRLGQIKDTDEYQEYAKQIARNELLRTRDATKEEIRENIQKLRTKAQSERANLRESLDANIANRRSVLDIATAFFNELQAKEKHNLEVELITIETARLAAIKAEEDKFNAVSNRLTKEENAIEDSMHRQIAQATQNNIKLRNAYGEPTIPTHGVITAPAGGAYAAPAVVPPNQPLGIGGFVGGMEYFAEGGMVTQPTLGVVGESGPEAVIPLNEAGGLGGVTINFTQPVFFDREDTMNRFVDMIRKGIQRQDRLRFGGAYNGG